MTNERNRIIRPRDVQRSRVYAADKSLQPHDRVDVSTVEAIESYVARVWHDPAVRQSFPKMWPYPPHVRDGRGRRSAAGCAHWIALPRDYRAEHIVLHELAHTITHQVHGPFNVAGHGPEYCAIYLRLVAVVMGEAAYAALHDAFIFNLVGFMPRPAARWWSAVAAAAACELDGGG